MFVVGIGHGDRWLQAAVPEIDERTEMGYVVGRLTCQGRAAARRAIALTGYGMESDVAASLEAGFIQHLTKPVDLAAYEAAIRRVSGSPD